MNYADKYCTYTEEYEPEHIYTFTGIVINTGKEQSVTVKAPDLFKYRQGAYIQDAFPYLSPAQREFLLSGHMFISKEDEIKMFNYQRARYRITCADGFSMSVQASELNYSTPKISGWDTIYSEVEIGFPSQIVKDLLPYAEDEDDPINTIYAYVPAIIVCKVIANHGNIDDGEVPCMVVRPPANKSIKFTKNWNDENAKQKSKKPKKKS